MVDCPPTSVPSMAPQTIHEPERPPVVKLFASFTLRPERTLTTSNKPTVRRMPMICIGVNMRGKLEKTAAKVHFFYDMTTTFTFTTALSASTVTRCSYFTMISSVKSQTGLPVARCHVGMVGRGMASTCTYLARRRKLGVAMVLISGTARCSGSSGHCVPTSCHRLPSLEI